MNYELLENLIPHRRLPDDHAAPRQKLHDLLRTLESLRDQRASAVLESDRAELDRKIRNYERLFE